MSFNDELYKLVTNPENWEIAKQISDNMADFVNHLINDFLEEIGENLKKEFNSEDWKVSIDDSENVIHNRQWDDSFSVRFGVETGKGGATYLGWHWKNFKEGLQVGLLDKLKKVDDRIKYIEDGYGCFCMDDFTRSSSLEQLLPSNRHRLIEKYSNIIIKFIENTNIKAPTIKKILESK